jgi:predicted nucleotidyltransferase
MAIEPQWVRSICERVAARLATIDGIEAVALGGSRARGTNRVDSDVDLGVYYDSELPFHIEQLEAAARELDDRHTGGLVTAFGAWGPGVNGGGWLLIEGLHVDFIYRDLRRVRDTIDRCVSGNPEALYQLGHPLGFQSQIYLGETHFAVPLFDRGGALTRLKELAKDYPEALRVALLRKHLFDSVFEIEIARKAAASHDTIYVAGCLFRAAGFMTLVLYALNRKFFLNEKGALPESEKFPIRPPAFHRDIRQILGSLGADASGLRASIDSMRRVHTGLAVLCATEVPTADVKSVLGPLWRE